MFCVRHHDASDTAGLAALLPGAGGGAGPFIAHHLWRRRLWSPAAADTIDINHHIPHPHNLYINHQTIKLTPELA